MFAGSPIKRIGRDRFVRNVLIAIGNSGDPALLPAAARACWTTPIRCVAEAAAWAVAASAFRRHAMSTRTETDSLGSIEIDADRCWGPQTERARRLFRIGTERFPPALIRAVGLQKQAAAEANLQLGELPRGHRRARSSPPRAKSPRASSTPNSRCRSGRPAPARRPT